MCPLRMGPVGSLSSTARTMLSRPPLVLSAALRGEQSSNSHPHLADEHIQGDKRVHHSHTPGKRQPGDLNVSFTARDTSTSPLAWPCSLLMIQRLKERQNWVYYKCIKLSRQRKTAVGSTVTSNSSEHDLSTFHWGCVEGVPRFQRIPGGWGPKWPHSMPHILTCPSLQRAHSSW